MNPEALLQQKLHHISTQAPLLSQAVLGKTYPIDTVCIFSQSAEEHTLLKSLILGMGTLSPFTHGATTYVECSLDIDGQDIKIVGVREPDETRPEVGYADYPVDDFDQLVEDARNLPGVKVMESGLGQALIEICHPDFDTCGYVVAAASHE